MIDARATVINDVLYVGGGSCPSDNDDYFIFSYKLTDDQWKRLPVLPHCYGVPTNINNELSFIGGNDPSTNRPTNKVITLQDDEWNTQYPSMIEAREDPAAIQYQHYIIVAGGIGEDLSVLNTIEVFDCDSYQWTTVSTHLPKPMKNISATICNESFIIAGYTDVDGCRDNGTLIIAVDSLVEREQQYSQTSSVNKSINEWNQLCPTPYWSTAIVLNSSPPVTIGGLDEQDKAVNSISLYNDSSNRWKEISTLSISCAGATVVTVNDTILVAGGYTDGSTREAINATSLTSVMLGQLDLAM